MTFKQFLSQYNGQQKVGNTPENKGQCVGLVSVWMDTFSIPHVWGHAKDLYANAPLAYFDKIPNSETAVPKEGDIVMWNSNMGGGYGHTAISTGTGNVNTFEVFEQNNPLNSNCHLSTYPDYSNVIGWLRIKAYTVPSTDDCPAKLTQVTAERDRLNGVITGKDETISHLGDTINAKNAEIASLNTTISSLNTQVATLTEQLATAIEQAKKVSNLTESLTACETSKKGYQSDLSKCQTQVGKIKSQLVPKKYLSLKIYNIIMALE